jgi:hypothetical protein
MTQPDLQPDIEPPISDGTSVPIQATKPISSRKSLSKISRELKDEDLASPAAQKMLLDEVERLETESQEGKDYRNRFHIADRDVAIYKEKLKFHKSLEVVHIACTTTGGICLGNATSTNPLIGIIGGVLVLAGIIAKIIKL